MMFLKRAVLLLSTVIALVVFLTVAYLFSGYRERRELLTGTPPANLVTLFAPRDALVRFEAGPHREVLWKQTDPEFVQPPEREDASSTQVLSVVRPPDAVSSEEGMRQELGTDREFWRSRENDGASDDVLQWQEENVEPEMLESAAVITPDYDVVRNGELYKEHSEEHSELSGALQSQEENAARPVLKYKVVKPPQIVGNEEVLVQNNPEFASLQKQSELSHQQDHQQQNQEEEFEEELNVVLVAESSNAEEGRDSVDESNHDKELQVMPFSIGNGVDPETSHNSETEIVDSHKPSAHTFPIRKGFQFPHPQVFLPTNTILGADWVQNLKDYLLTIHPSRSLTITVATKSFIPNLLNWLIAAHLLVQPPMENVLVLAFDRDVHMLMARRKIPNVYVPIRSVMKGLRRGVSTIWMTRFAVIRLLNHWGYDVLQLDNDAIPLKDPRFLYDPYTEYDIVGARGILPFELGRGPWGFTLCMGAALLKGTEKMGEGAIIYIVFLCMCIVTDKVGLKIKVSQSCLGYTHNCIFCDTCLAQYYSRRHSPQDFSP